MIDELLNRPTETTYDHLSPGDEGYWPMIGAVPDDMLPGDRVHFTDDACGQIIAEVVTGSALRSWPCRIGYKDLDGKLWTVGRMAQGFRLDRWGTSSTLSTRGVR